MKGSSENSEICSENVLRIKVETCSSLYEKWKDEKSWFHNVPRKGITTEVEYIDTRPDAGNTLPVVLCLHGAPGSHQDFTLLRSRLVSYPIRIICPNFPTYSLTKAKKFGHYAEEKAEYILDFLKALQLTRVDMLISHSSSIYPSVIILESEYGSTLKSLVFLNPCGHRRIQAMKYPLLDKTSAYFYQYKFFRFFIKHFGKPVLIIASKFISLFYLYMLDDSIKSTGIVINIPDRKSSGITCLHKLCDSFQVFSLSSIIFITILSKRLEQLKANKEIAKMLIFSENDKLIQKEIFYEMAKMLGIESDNIEVYDHNGLQQKSSIDSGYPKGIALQDGGHYAFLSHSKIVNEAIAGMVENWHRRWQLSMRRINIRTKYLERKTFGLSMSSLNHFCLRPTSCLLPLHPLTLPSLWLVVNALGVAHLFNLIKSRPIVKESGNANFSLGSPGSYCGHDDAPMITEIDRKMNLDLHHRSGLAAYCMAFSYLNMNTRREHKVLKAKSKKTDDDDECNDESKHGLSKLNDNYGSFRHVIKQDINGIKTVVLRLQGLLHNSVSFLSSFPVT
uniref:AB hydrolase-1 domain-containing protein n=2 Tax=Tetranychus urticae TaxID=32264 RepID=T1KFT7_TETUR